MCYSACQQNCVCTRLAYFTLYDDTRRLFITGTGESGRATRHTVGPPRRDNVHTITRPSHPASGLVSSIRWVAVSSHDISEMHSWVLRIWLVDTRVIIYVSGQHREERCIVCCFCIGHPQEWGERNVSPTPSWGSEPVLARYDPILNYFALKRTQLVSGY